MNRRTPKNAKLMTTFLKNLLALRFMPRGWALGCFAALGVLGGVGLLLGHVSRATSYLSDEPETCMNCHVMGPQYVTWQHGSHANVATCNDCHVPHDNVVSKYAFKARDGLWHSTVFTMRWEPQAIRLSKRAVPVVEENCRRCHEPVIDEVCLRSHAPGDMRCWECHREVPHGTARSLSATPEVFRPQLPSVEKAAGDLTIGGRRVRP